MKHEPSTGLVGWSAHCVGSRMFSLQNSLSSVSSWLEPLLQLKLSSPAAAICVWDSSVAGKLVTAIASVSFDVVKGLLQGEVDLASTPGVSTLASGNESARFNTRARDCFRGSEAAAAFSASSHTGEGVLSASEWECEPNKDVTTHSLDELRGLADGGGSHS